MYFKSERKVFDYDCDVNHNLKISSVMRYMQQCSSEQMSSIGIPVVKLFNEDMVFLLSKMCIKVHQMPKSGENIIVGTAAVDIKGAQFVREFCIDDIKGNRMVSAISLWVLVNPKTRKILRPKSFPYQMHLKESFINYDEFGDLSIPKLLGEGKELSREIKIEYSHIDCNNHVNNSYYGDFICDSIPYNQLVSRGIENMILAFENEAKWGDIVNISTRELSETEYYVRGTHNGTACFKSIINLNKTALHNTLISDTIVQTKS